MTTTIYKKRSKEERDKCKITTLEFRVSHPHVFTAWASKPADKKKFQIEMLYPKKDSSGKDIDYSGLSKVVTNAKNVEWGSKDKWPQGLKGPIIDGDKPKYANKKEYHGKWIVRASTGEKQRPEVVGPDREPIINEADFYAGCYAVAHLYAVNWEHSGKQGIKFILEAVMKTRDGKPFSARTAAKEVFKNVAVPMDDEAETDDEDLTSDFADSEEVEEEHDFM